MAVKWSKPLRIKFDNLQVNSNHFKLLHGYGQDISQGSRWFTGSYAITIQRRKMVCFWPIVLETALTSIHASVHPSWSHLWNIMNDTEMNKAWSLFPKSSQSSDKQIKRKLYFKKKWSKCRMAVRITCFSTCRGVGGHWWWKEPQIGLGCLRTVFYKHWWLCSSSKKNVWELYRQRRWEIFQEKGIV